MTQRPIGGAVRPRATSSPIGHMLDRETCGDAQPASFGARRGSDILGRMRTQPPNLWYAGQPIRDVTVHPATRRIAATLASLYDLQWSAGETMLFESPSSGARVNRSFMIPRTKDDVAAIGAASKVWADATCGMMGRAPDYLNRAIASFAGGAAFLSQQGRAFGDNVVRYHEYMREHDLSLTHTFITPQANRSVGVAAQADPYLAARVVKETSAGIVIQGCRLLATLPLADELMVFPSTLLKGSEDDAPYAFGICTPTNAEGLKFLCRESVDYGGARQDHPLGSRFEELDAVVFFDGVFVPWERVFLYRDVSRCNDAYLRTGAIVHMAHQAVVRSLAKTEFLMGLASLLAQTIAIEKFQHIQEKLAEIWVNMEAMRAFRRASEVDATLDEYGVMRPAWAPLDAARNLFPRLYPRMVEILQQMGASGLVALPTAADIAGPLSPDITRYFQAARADAHERIPLFRLAWDTSVSAFANRQVLYERFFAGDPVRMAATLVTTHDCTRYMDRVRDLLANGGPDGSSGG